VSNQTALGWAAVQTPTADLHPSVLFLLAHPFFGGVLIFFFDTYLIRLLPVG